MRRALRWTLAAVAALVVGCLAALWWLRIELARPHSIPGTVVLEVRPGWSARQILERLERGDVVADATLARAWLVYGLGDPPLQAGEYAFEGAMTIDQVLQRLVRGDVLTHPVTIPEGLTLDETAEVLAGAGFGDLGRLQDLVRDPSPVADLDPDAPDLEGYLFPDTYHFARSATEEEVVAKLVATFRAHWDETVRPRLADPAGRPRAIVTLASIVEKESFLDEERPTIAGVYAHRLRRGIALYADPTIIYALKRAGTWDGDLRRRDLVMDSPYNTYRNAGLPPGPICSPGLPSLLAAADPPAVPYLYFVSRNDGSHVFAETLAEHNRNVETWQRRYWRERAAAEGAGDDDGEEEGAGDGP